MKLQEKQITEVVKHTTPLQERKKNSDTNKSRMKLITIVNFHLSRFCYDTRVEELVPRVGQPGKTPMDTIGVGGRISLLFWCQHFALTDGID